MKFTVLLAGTILLVACSAVAQSPAVAQSEDSVTIQEGDSGNVFYWAQAQAPAPEPGQRAERGRRVGPPGNVTLTTAHMMGPWWKNAEIANQLHLTDQQKKEIDQSFYQYRLQLIDATAATQKLDMQLDNLMNADYLEEAQINQTLDQLVQARGQLSKIYAGMLISIRKVLLPEQWRSLQDLQAEKGMMPMMLMPMMLPGGPTTFGMGMPPAAGGVIFNRRVQAPAVAPIPPAPPSAPGAPPPPQP
jgi:Spy/CpxP family protein refolding chaperone